MSRETILRRIRTVLGPKREPVRSRAVAARLAAPPRHPRPAFAELTGPERETRLIQCLETQGATVISIPDLAALPAAVATLLTSPQGERERHPLFIADDSRLSALPWPTGAAPRRWTPGETLGDGYATLTHAEAAVAETGTLVLASSPASPASLAFLPEVHLVALARDTIAASFESAFARLVAAAPGRLPRAINLVSGPSRTGDIGGRIVKGAHGPRRLIVIVYGPPSEGGADLGMGKK